MTTDKDVQLTIQVNADELAAAFRKLGEQLLESFRPVVEWWAKLPAALREAAERRAKTSAQHQHALDQLDDALDEAEAIYGDHLAGLRYWATEVQSWAVHHQTWAALEPGVTWEQVSTVAQAIFSNRRILNWSPDEAAEVVTGMLTGWQQRLAFRELHPGAI